MGSPVSPIVANPCMEEIEELAHKQSTSPGKKRFRFVVDIFPSSRGTRLPISISYSTSLTHILSSPWKRNYTENCHS